MKEERKSEEEWAKRREREWKKRWDEGEKGVER